MKTQNPRRRLLGAAEKPVQKFPVLRVEHRHKVAAVVHDDVRLRLDERLFQKAVVFFRRAGMGREDVHAVFHQRRRHVVLRGERIAARHRDLRPGIFQHLGKIGGLRLQMNRQHHAAALERLRL